MQSTSGVCHVDVRQVGRGLRAEPQQPRSGCMRRISTANQLHAGVLLGGSPQQWTCIFGWIRPASLPCIAEDLRMSHDACAGTLAFIHHITHLRPSLQASAAEEELHLSVPVIPSQTLAMVRPEVGMTCACYLFMIQRNGLGKGRARPLSFSSWKSFVSHQRHQFVCVCFWLQSASCGASISGRTQSMWLQERIQNGLQ